jgi:hypothetical protein
MRYALSIPAFLLLVGAAWFLFAGLTIDTTVPTSEPAFGGGIANLQLMHIQMLDIVIGLVSGLTSAVLFTGAAIVATVQDRAAE